MGFLVFENTIFVTYNLPKVFIIYLQNSSYAYHVQTSCLPMLSFLSIVNAL